MFNQRFIISKRNEVGLTENWNQFNFFPHIAFKIYELWYSKSA